MICKYTPFPWHKRRVQGGYAVCGPPEEGNPHPCICTVHHNMYGNVDDNTTLILSIPIMLATCEAMEQYREHIRHCRRCREGWRCSTGSVLWNGASELLTKAMKAVRGE